MILAAENTQELGRDEKRADNQPWAPRPSKQH